VDSLVEEVVEKQVLEFGVAAVRLGDVLQENGANDAATAPHERNLGLVQLPLVLLGGLLDGQYGSGLISGCTCALDQHETLGVRNNLRRVQSLLEVVDDGLAVSREAWAGSIKNTGSTSTLSLERTQATSEDCLTDQGDGHSEVQSVDSGPLAGTLLASGIHDLLNNGNTIVVVLVHDIASDLDQERVEHTLVPLGEDIAHLLVGHAKSTLHDVVGLANQLHVTVLDTVVDHLDVVSSTLVTDPLTAGLAVGLCGDRLEDVLECCQKCIALLRRFSHLNVWPCLLVTTGHDAGAVTGTLLSSRDTASDKSNALLGEVLGAAVCVGVVRVTAVDDDVALLDTTLGEEKLDEVVDGLSGHDEHHHATGLLELGDELLDGVCANNGLALCLCFVSDPNSSSENLTSPTIVQESVDLGDAASMSVCACAGGTLNCLRSVESNNLRAC
jgi:hypothetical protein